VNGDAKPLETKAIGRQLTARILRRCNVAAALNSLPRSNSAAPS